MDEMRANFPVAAKLKAYDAAVLYHDRMIAKNARYPFTHAFFNTQFPPPNDHRHFPPSPDPYAFGIDFEGASPEDE